MIHDTEEGPEWIKDLNKLVSIEDEPLSNNSAHFSPPLNLSSFLDSDEEDIINPSKAYDQSSTVSSQTIDTKNDQNSDVPSIKIENKSSYLEEDTFSVRSAEALKNASPSSTSPAQIQTTITQPPSKSSSASSLNLSNNRVPSPVPSSTLNNTLAQPRNLNLVNENLQQIHRQLQIELFKQLLKLKNINFEWFDIIMPLVWKCVDLVRPDVKHDNDHMDIRNYIKIKKLPGYNKNESKIVHGLVFSKNVVHRQMKNEMKNPKILLFRSSIEYQRTEEKMCSLEPIFTAESQYLKNYCSKLLLRQSHDILVVEKSVARIAQEFFLQNGITLVLNVKSSIMDKLGRFLQADPMFSIDDLVRKPKLGVCTKFYVKSYKMPNGRQKPLMFFEGTPTNLGCTILLCGASSNELNVIKSLTKFMIYVAYNSKLEQSFILDKYADFFATSIYDVNNELILTKEAERQPEKSVKLAIVSNENNKKEEWSNGGEATTKMAETSQTNESTNKQNTDGKKLAHAKEEISIDQSPLDDAKPLVDNEAENRLCEKETSSNLLEANNSNNPQLKLTICEQHKEKNSQNLNRNFKLLLNDLLLSCSPFIQYQMPFLLNENTNDLLKRYLPASYMNYLRSSILLDSFANAISSPENTFSFNNEQVNEKKNDTIHEFLLMHLSKSFDDFEFKKLYADFKSRGGIASMNNTKRLLLNNNDQLPSFDETNQTIFKKNSLIPTLANTTTAGPLNKLASNKFDCLDVFNRQHLAVLFYSQCESSPLYPNICNKPRIINMKFYGENDMTLGSFLARNCFRQGYKCTNEMCDTLIVYHTRSFVHADARITIRISIVPTANNITATNLTNTSSQAQSSAQTNTQDENKSNFAVPIKPPQQQLPQQQFANLSVNALMMNSYSNSKMNALSASQPLSVSNTMNKPVANEKNAQPTVLSTSPNPFTQQQQQQQQKDSLNNSVVYDDMNIFMWSVCKICNKVNETLFS